MIPVEEAQPLSPLYDTKKECIYCHEFFTTKKVRSKFIRVSKRDSDLCNHYEGVNPYYIMKYLCVLIAISLLRKNSVLLS